MAGIQWIVAVCSIPLLFSLLICNIHGEPESGNVADPRKNSHNVGIVQFNNPKLLHSNVDVNDEGYVFDTTQEDVDPLKMGGIHIREEARKLALKLRKLSNEEIGVTAMQGIYDSLPYAEISPDYQLQLKEFSTRLETKLDQYLNLLRTIKITTETLYTQHLSNPLTRGQDCCSLPKSELQWSDQFQCAVSQKLVCDLVPHNVSPFSFNPGRNLTEVFQLTLGYKASTRWQYFISTDGIHSEYPAHNYQHMPYSDCKHVQDHRHRDVYVKTVSPQRKHVVIVMDHGNSLSTNQLNIAKEISKHLVSSLGEDDWVGFVGLSSEPLYPRDDGCLNQRLCPLKYETKLFLKEFIDNLDKKKMSVTNHSLGFQEAFRLIENTLVAENRSLRDEDLLIAYVSRGLLSSLVEAKAVFEMISASNGALENQVIINTYTIIDDNKPILYEKAVLEDIANQNFEKYSVQPAFPEPPKRGQMSAVNSLHDLSTLVGSFYRVFGQPTPNTPHISLPFPDTTTEQGVLVSLTWPCFDEGHLIGIVGIDVPLGEIVEDVTYYKKNQNVDNFLIDKHGFTVMHPALERPYLMQVQPMHTDITHFENTPGFETVRQRMLSETEGVETLELTSPDEATYHPNQMLKLPEVTSVTYAWKHLVLEKMNGSPFIAVVKQVKDGKKLKDIKTVHVASAPQLVYHRLDLLPTDSTCMHLKQLATLDTSSLFLSASAFQAPFEHLSQPETKRMVQGYLAFLNDNTNLISNPGIKNEIKKDVLATDRINSEWKLQYIHSQLNDYIVRRYVATPSGVFRMFPGTLLNKAYDPTRRNWYMRALEFPGQVTLSAPYLDNGGAGYIVTISHTIYEGQTAAVHTPADTVAAVMGIDVTLKYFYKVLIQQLPDCKQDHIRCFIMDDRGYVIAHQGLIEPTGKGPLEQKHITHKEPLAANDILNHKGFVRKKLCNGYTDRTIQRFYQFNTSLDGVVTNLVHGEHCAKYQVTAVPGTNVFLGIVNETCNNVRAFCPCSMIDRLCLNCRRMEQSECECPCECPLDMDFCTGKLLFEEDRNPSCMRYPEETELVEIPREAQDALGMCYQSRCVMRKTKMDCLGVLDCEWCELDNDGITPLKEAFCSSQRVCFAGVLGAPTPYNDQIVFKAATDDHQEVIKSTPVGPVAGGIMGCFLVLALAVYCYRHHVHRHSQHHYMVGLQPDGVGGRMAPLDNEMEELDSPEEPGASGHTNIILASFENPASISPYRMNTTYRRPTNAESDLGYSTMTPQDDSEQASTTCIEPLIISRDRYRPPSSIASKSSSILPPPPSGVGANYRHSRSPSPPHLSPLTRLLLAKDTPIPEQTQDILSASSLVPGQTLLPMTADLMGPNQVVANVQVHMVDTH